MSKRVMGIHRVGAVPDTEISKQFLQGMVSRMEVSWAKYGPIADAYPHKVNAIESLKERLVKYQATGNTEWLMDVANFAMIEFLRPSIAGASFRATDSAASPGRVWLDGLSSDKRNNHDSESIQRRVSSRAGD